MRGINAKPDCPEVFSCTSSEWNKLSESCGKGDQQHAISDGSAGSHLQGCDLTELLDSLDRDSDSFDSCEVGRLVRSGIKSLLRQLEKGDEFDKHNKDAVVKLFDRYYMTDPGKEKWDTTKVDAVRKYEHAVYKEDALEFHIDGKWERVGLCQYRWANLSDPASQLKVFKGLLTRKLEKEARLYEFDTSHEVTCSGCGEALNRDNNCYAEIARILAWEFLDAYNQQEIAEMLVYDEKLDCRRINEEQRKNFLEIVKKQGKLPWAHEACQNEMKRVKELLLPLLQKEAWMYELENSFPIACVQCQQPIDKDDDCSSRKVTTLAQKEFFANYNLQEMEEMYTRARQRTRPQQMEEMHKQDEPENPIKIKPEYCKKWLGCLTLASQQPMDWAHAKCPSELADSQ
eukprot:TRINITY_DN113307_c0_g1_i1.p1 TRINITY_DN113307_c0_g1~~TRINITY_DN113307_c0_g1_i1.p1  ORF type:complete len:401 (-),score=46.26 TRINITY_DN113307_c0_g1_i1:390-1592(-)